jgi:hypothetical protein
MNKDTAKALLIANLKGGRRKRSKLTTIAEAVRLLKGDRKYESSKELARAFGVSRQIIESFDKINDQPKEIQKLIDDGKILLDASTKLASVSDIPRRLELARVVAGETAFDTRYIIDYAKKHPELSAKECKEEVFASKDVTRNLHVLVIPLEEELFRNLRLRAATKKMRLEQAAKLAIQEWLGGQL